MAPAEPNVACATCRLLRSWWASHSGSCRLKRPRSVRAILLCACHTLSKIARVEPIVVRPQKNVGEATTFRRRMRGTRTGA